MVKNERRRHTARLEDLQSLCRHFFSPPVRKIQCRGGPVSVLFSFFFSLDRCPGNFFDTVFEKELQRGFDRNGSSIVGKDNNRN